MSSLIFNILAHLQISFTGVIIAAIIGIPLGSILKRYPRAANISLTIVDAIQTIPTMAMFSFLMVVFGMNNRLVIASITLYALFPILRNTYTAITEVDPGIVRAGRGLGMTEFQLFYRVELPLAAPVIISGIRLAIVSALGITTTGALVGASGLGTLIWRGVQIRNFGMILTGAIPVSLLALLSNYLIEYLEKKLKGKRNPQKKISNTTEK